MQLRLKTVSANKKDNYVRMPLRLKRRHEKLTCHKPWDNAMCCDRVLAENRRLQGELMETASHRWFRCERVMHWLFYGDRERLVSEDEKVWMKNKAQEQSLARRKARNRWSPYQHVQFTIENAIGGNVAQVFTFYQFIMDNNFVMSSMWTCFVIIPYFFDPPAEFDLSKITWIGLAGLDDKGLEYSWFYYGAYKSTVKMWGFDYPMDIMYIIVLLLMFFFQLSVMMWGVFESLFDDVNVQKEYDHPFDGIHWAATLLCSSNHCIHKPEIKLGVKVKTIAKFKQMISKKKQQDFERNNKGETLTEAGEEVENPFFRDVKIVVGRTIGVIMYLGLFQISTNGIQACYENEESINGIMPFAVPVLVTAQRVLVPVLLVPQLLRLEFREEPNLFYHTIVRMFLLKVYTMNVILQVLLSTPVPGGICRAIFIGKVYWRQEMVDLVFCLVLDLIMVIRRRRLHRLPEFDEEEMAERVMELLYRQAFIWVSAPYSPMLAYLALFSTSVLYFWQAITIPMSYVAPVNGWGVKSANKSFRIQLLCTAVTTFFPTTIFLHQKMDCGPHVTAASPYQYIHEKVQEGPALLASMTYWATIPSTTIALLIVSVGLQVFLSAVNASRTYKVNTSIDNLDNERHDKVQLLRSCGLDV